MSKIRVLSEETVNQIAAGEVIENPASVVKELVENALDAGAAEIRIETKGGGLQWICVSDNGSGMNSDDALLCLERHATSKIHKVEDLWALKTMGFRGEALASIAAISKLTLTTAQGESGTQLVIEGGKLLESGPCARTRGTTVDVRSLFYNVPARKKFQKSAALCSAEITRVLTLLSLAYPKTAFHLVQNGRQILSLPAPTGSDPLFSRAASVLGEEFCASSFRVDGKGVAGFIGDPQKSRPIRSGQYLFINQRSIFSSLVSWAVKDGYGTRIPENRYPTYLLYLTIDPQQVDVNVHPQKKEVRFLEEKGIKALVQETVSRALQRPETPLPALEIPPSLPAAPVRFPMPELSSLDMVLPWEESPPPLKFKEEREPPALPELPLVHTEIRPIGLFAHFLLLEENKQLLIVDLLAARARIIFESLLKEIRKEQQGLLVPMVLEVSREESAHFEAHMPHFEEMGFSLRLSGANSFMVEAIPSFLEMSDVLDALRRVGQEFSSPFEERVRSLSRFARSGKKSFMLEEAIALYRELKKCQSPHQCPQGKRTMLYLSQDDVAKKF